MRWLRLHHLQVLTEEDERPVAVLLAEPKLKALMSDMVDQPGPGRQGKRCFRGKVLRQPLTMVMTVMMMLISSGTHWGYFSGTNLGGFGAT